MNRDELRALVQEILRESGGEAQVLHAALPEICVTEADRLDTGRPGDAVYTRDLFTLAESPRLGAGIMEMRNTTFDWTLAYDEIDYIIAGRLSVICGGRTVSAGPGEVILIPRGSRIQFSAPESARFLYVTYPADWQNA